MKNAKRGVERIKKVILQDRTGAQDNIIGVLKSDLYEILDGFFEVNPQSVVADVTVDNAGMYDIRLSARAFRVRGVRAAEADDSTDPSSVLFGGIPRQFGD